MLLVFQVEQNSDRVEEMLEKSWIWSLGRGHQDIIDVTEVQESTH